jgi:hypothetical protein
MPFNSRREIGVSHGRHNSFQGKRHWDLAKRTFGRSSAETEGGIETPDQFRARNSGAIPVGSRICAARSQKRSQNLTGHAQHLN